MRTEDWNAGKECDRHGMGWCGQCLDADGQRRDADGVVRWKSDCTVSTYCELAGVDYEVASAVLREVGFVPGSGLHREKLLEALRVAGFRVTRVCGRYEAIVTLPGRFYVSGQKGKSRHSWTIVGGKVSRPLHPPFRFQAWEISG